MTRCSLIALFLMLATAVAEEDPATAESDRFIEERLGRIETKLAVIEGHLKQSAMPFQDAEFQLRVRVHDDGHLSILGRTISDKELADTLELLKPLFLRGRVLVVTGSNLAFERVKFVHDEVKRLLPNSSVAFATQTIQAEQGSAGEPATRSESDSEGDDNPQPESDGGSR